MAEVIPGGWGQEVAWSVESVAQGARSAAELTRRLLAFSRRQALAPVQVDLNRLVAAMSELLRRTVGEAVSIETVLAGGLWATLVDANGLENVLVNLVVNARDAMPGGGRVTIETANIYLDEAYAARFGDVAAGQYVLLSVSDTGGGISSELMPRVFEPFFTTKQGGEGSGLGLAMVHGFVKQSGGHIRLYSEVGQGTTVKIYLPRRAVALPLPAAPAEMPPAPGGLPRARPDETILLVEDNDSVRDYATTALTELGYRVIAARDGTEALRLFADHEPDIRLVFLDVMMPNGDGRHARRLIGERRPDLPILFATGYAERGAREAIEDPLIEKPYSGATLLGKVREILDQRPGRGDA